MPKCKECGGKIIRKGIWFKHNFKIATMKTVEDTRFYPAARVCEKCGRIVSL